MNSIVKQLAVIVVCAAFARAVVQAEVADAVYRDGVVANINDHAAVMYRFDNANVVFYVIHSAGSASYEPNSVRIGTWADFLGGNNFVGQKCPANLSKGVRDSVISDALDQLGAHYWGYGPFTWCYKHPNSSSQSGDGCFRCDFLVEWLYEQNGYDVCNDTVLYDPAFHGPKWQLTQMPDAVQTRPVNVLMSYPSATDPNAPTISSSSSITLRASASDAHSGLSYNKPYDYHYALYQNGSWGSWQFLASDWGTRNYTTPAANTLYAWYVEAFDNEGNSEVSPVYYFKWVPNYTITASAGTGGTISPSGSLTKSAGSSQAFTASPNTNYVVNQWLQDGGIVQNGGASYTLSNIQAGHSVQVTFTYVPPQYTITASAGTGGTISPSGSLTKTADDSQAFTASPNANYVVNQWLLDGGVVQTGGTSFTIRSIQASHNVMVTFNLAQPQMTEINLSNGTFHFLLNGPTGSDYVVEVSSNLVNWSTFSIGTIPAGGSDIVTDAGMGSQERRFYRAVQGPTNTVPTEP